MAGQSGQIQTNALAPSKVVSDGVDVAQHPIGDQIKGDQYAAAAAGVKKINRGLRFSKLLPAGAVSDQQGAQSGSRGGSGFDTSL